MLDVSSLNLADGIEDDADWLVMRQDLPQRKCYSHIEGTEA
jgi:hypothetical protein